MRNYLLGLAACVAVASSPASAAVVFSDNFDSYAPTLNWNGSGVWSTANSVDLVANNTFGLTCAGGSGNCVDLTQSGITGSMTTLVNLAPGTYSLSFDYTGNQLGAQFAQAGFTVSVGALLNSVIGPLSNTNSVFTTYNGQFTVVNGGQYALNFTQNGGDLFRGSILDNVSISTVASVLPEPTTWAMMIAGFGAVGLSLRRRGRNGVSRISFS